jgi:hypothetical protein
LGAHRKGERHQIGHFGLFEYGSWAEWTQGEHKWWGHAVEVQSLLSRAVTVSTRP